jgi:hypothetical protein
MFFTSLLDLLSVVSISVFILVPAAVINRRADEALRKLSQEEI